MIKGAQKRVVVVRTADSGIFEEALFVLRRGSVARESDMVAEADRIIRESGGRKRRVETIRRILFALVTFFCGSAFGGALIALILLI